MESPPGSLKKFVLHAWYKISMSLGVALFVIFLFVEIKGITNTGQLLAGGFFFLGIGEWINHRDMPPIFELGTNTLWITKNLWKPKILGLVLDLIGISLIFLAIISITNYFL